MTNPFAPPVSGARPPSDPAVGPWQHQGRIVARRGNLWPRRCAKCNAPVSEADPVRIEVEWLPLWVYLLLLPAALLYVILRLSMRRRGWVRVFLCPTHRWVRIAERMATPICAAAVFVGGMALTGTTDHPIWMVLCLGALIAVFVLPLGTVWAHAIEGVRLDLRGGGKAFVASLPPWVEGAFDYEVGEDLGNIDP